MRKLLTPAVVLLAMLAPSPGALAQPELRVDAIDLLDGRTVDGSAAFACTHDGVTYYFATAEHRAKFLEDPARYEVADGGACGSMGPLSGLGDGTLFAVHEGHIYFFASPGCRATFQRDPAKCIEGAQPAPEGTPEQRSRGLAEFNRMIAWAGGEAALRAVSTLKQERVRTEKSGDKEYRVVDRFTAEFPASFRQLDAWNQSAWSTVSTARGGAKINKGEFEVLAESRRRALVRWAARHPVVLMKARFEPGFTVVADGDGEINGTQVSFVLVGLHGATSRIAIAKDDGRPVRLSFRGRDETPFVGDSDRTFTEYAESAGVRCPIAWTTIFDGQPKEKLTRRYETFELNAALPADEFAIGE